MASLIPVTLKGLPAPRTLVFSPERAREFLEQSAPLKRTERQQQLERYELHFRCRQYDHLPYDWWGRQASLTETVSPAVVAPPGFVQPKQEALTMRDKRPTAPTGIVRTVIKRLTGLLFSAKRLPKVRVDGDPATEEALQAVMKQMRFWVKMRYLRDMGGAMGSACATVHLRDGKFALDIHNTKDLTVLWKDRSSWTPLAILKMYEYPVEEQVLDAKTGNPTGETRTVRMLYRRIITEAEDIVYTPIRLEAGAEIKWDANPALSVRHDLGYFPGVWVQNHLEEEDMDGPPDCEGGWGLSDTDDRILSQMNQGAANNLDPTAVIKYDPKEVARIGELHKGSENAITPGVSGDAHYMEITGAGIDAGERVHRTLKASFLDLVRCVLVDPEKITGAATSGKAIELMFEPMLTCADELREQYGDAIVRILEIACKMARRVQGVAVKVSGTSRPGVFLLNLPGRAVRLPGLPSREPHAFAEDPEISLEWGPYFTPSDEDNQRRVQNAVAAREGGLIQRTTATEHVAAAFGVEDIEAEVAAAQGEGADDMDAALASAMGVQEVPGPGGPIGAVPPGAAPAPGAVGRVPPLRVAPGGGTR